MPYRCCLTIALFSVLQAGQEPVKFSGTLEPHLVADRSVSWGAGLTPASQAFHYSGQIKLGGDLSPLPVLLIELPGQTPHLFADLNRDGQFSDSESFPVNPVSDRPRASGEATIQLPLDSGHFSAYPIRVTLFRPDDASDAAAPRRIAYSFLAFATCTVEVDGRPVRIWCSFDLRTRTLDPLNSTVGMDLDGDGRMGMPPSPEWANAKNELPVFRLGARYLSIQSVDPAAHSVTLIARSASDYHIIEVSPGAIVPDFEFTDFNGQVRRLSEFQGRYVLLDFWGSWCAPCIAQFPHLKRAYEALQARGFEIIGIDINDSLEDAKKCAAEHDLPWVQATAESTAELVERRFRITAFPAVILLDPQRRIISTGQNDINLYGEDLLKTLESILPPT